MTRALQAPTVQGVNLRDLPRIGNDGPPVALRAFGLLATLIILLSTLTTKPYPDVEGDGALVSVGIVLFVVGLLLSARRADLRRGQRFAGICMVGVAACLFTAFQPNSAGYAAIFYVAVIAGMRIAPPASLIAIGGTLVAQCAIVAFAAHHPQTTVPGLVFSVAPWYLITRLIRRLAARTNDAETLVEELRESRSAHAEAAAMNERGRLARDMHDVLAHSLSALALQLEGTRLLARETGADPEVTAGLERAHRLAAGGLAEARQAIAALRGDALPGPERLQELADAFGANATLSVIGEPRETSSEARLALYRTAQEALTNIRKHSAADRVEIRLEYAADGTRLRVQDHGPGAPVMVGGGGYGLTGMKERAELLGGTLEAGPTADGFRVELWLPDAPSAPAQAEAAR
jgi:signal transduction histidine kinase